jgi:hypothetical protein
LATIAIVPDDGPVWPKHVLKYKLTNKVALKTAISNVRASECNRILKYNKISILV